jgi:hypothetical protein
MAFMVKPVRPRVFFIFTASSAILCSLSSSSSGCAPGTRKLSNLEAHLIDRSGSSPIGISSAVHESFR